MLPFQSSNKTSGELEGTPPTGDSTMNFLSYREKSERETEFPLVGQSSVFLRLMTMSGQLDPKIGSNDLSIDKALDHRRSHMIVTHNPEYSDVVMEFLTFEAKVESTIRLNAGKWPGKELTQDDLNFRSKFEYLRAKELDFFGEDLLLLEIKYNYHFGDSEFKYYECQKLLQEVDLDKFHISARRNQLLAECSIIRAIILKSKIGSYFPNSSCFKLMKHIAERRFKEGQYLYYEMLAMVFNRGDLKDSDGDDYFKILIHHFDTVSIEAPLNKAFKQKDIKSYQTIDLLIEKAKIPRTRELTHVFCCLGHDMPGIRDKWLHLLDTLGAAVTECSCDKEGRQKEFHVNRDRDRHSVDMTAMDLMDTTITVIIQDLFY